MKNTQIYDYVIPAGGSVQILTEGTYFRILSSTGPVEVDADTYGNILVLAGQGIKDQPFKRLFLNDKSGQQNAVSLVISDGSFVDDRITGEVSVIDGELSKTLAGNLFSSTIYSPPVAAKYSASQLFNPMDSGKNIIVGQLFFSSGATATSVGLAFENAPLTTDVSSLSIGGKKSGGGVGEALAKVEAKNGRFTSNIFSISIQANSYFPWLPKGQLVITPGWGMTLVNSTANLGIAMQCEFEEVPL